MAQLSVFLFTNEQRVNLPNVIEEALKIKK